MTDRVGGPGSPLDPQSDSATSYDLGYDPRTTRLRRKLQRLFRDWQRTGLFCTAKLYLCRASRSLPPWFPGVGRLVKFHLRGAPHPFWIRFGSTDVEVFRQIFSEREYAGLAETLEADPLIIDIGAHIGCSSFWFLWRRPDARVICLEPLPANVELCRRNLAPFAHSVKVVEGAAWSSASPLRFERNVWRHEWASTVRGLGPGEAASDLAGVPIDELLPDEGDVDLMKIDIEGAEVEIMPGASSWLKRTRNLVLELHGGDSLAALQSALTDFGWSKMIKQGELVAFRGLHPVTDDGT